MRYLVPVARVNSQDCEQLAAAFHSLSLRFAASWATICGLARWHAEDARADSCRTGVVFEDTARCQCSPTADGKLRRDLEIVIAPIGGYVAALKQKSRKVVVLALRQLSRLVKEYPRGALVAAVEQAAHYGLYDLDRLERMILHRVARDYFLLKETQPGEDD